VHIIEFLKVFYTLFFVWLTCFTAIFVLTRSLPLINRQFAFFIILLCIMETIGNAIGFFGKINNHFFFNILYAVELTGLPFFFNQWLRRVYIKKIIPVFFYLFPLFIIANTLWVQGFFTLQTYSFVLGGSFVLALSVSYLWQLYTNEEFEIIIHNPVFWFCLAYLLYFAVTVPFFGMLNYLVKNQLEFAGLYYSVIIDSTICIYNVLLTIGFLCMKAPVK
jgi:hypothetical protein